MDFSSKEALAIYLKEHPGANRRKHRVVKPPKKQTQSLVDSVMSKFKHISASMRSALSSADDQVLELVISDEARKKVGNTIATAIEKSPDTVSKLIKDGMVEETRSSLDGLKVARNLLTKGPHKLSARESLDLYTFCSYAIMPVVAAFPPGGLILAAGALGKKYLMGVGLNIGIAIAQQASSRKTASEDDSVDVYAHVAAQLPAALREGLTDKQMEVVMSTS